ncbi:MAG: NADPH-dependent FMN reductase [Dehalococcoidia bacterium]
MPEPIAVAISGSPRSPSKSKMLAELMLETLAKHGCATRMIDLATLPADALLARAASAGVDGAIAAAGEARIVIAATPTYRALYTGLLKAFFDLMPQGHLAGKACVALQTAGVPHHSLAVEYGLYPLFRSLDGTPAGAVYATDDEFADGQPASELTGRVEAAAATALRIATS